MDFLPAIAPNQDLTCALCGAKQTVGIDMQHHHYVPRSLGGTETLLLCVRCHGRTEGDAPWKVGVTSDYVFAVDHTGEVIIKRWFPPADFDEGLVVAEIEQGSERLTQLSRYFRYLSDEALDATAEALVRLSDSEWHASARWLQEKLLRWPYGDRNQRLTQLARQYFDIGHAMARRRIQALAIVEQHPELEAELPNLPSPEVIIAADKYGDVVENLSLYRDRKATGKYRDSQFKEELRRGNTDSMRPPPEWHLCPECSQPHVRKEA